jgi:hypothetical protein
MLCFIHKLLPYYYYKKNKNKNDLREKVGLCEKRDRSLLMKKEVGLIIMLNYFTYACLFFSV